MDFSALVGCVGYRMSFGWLKGKWQSLLSGAVDGFFWGLLALLIACVGIPSISLLVAVAMDAFHISVTSADWEAVQSFCYTGFFLGLGYLLIISNWGDLLVTIWKVEDLSIYRKCTYSSVTLVVLSLGAVLFTGLCEIFVWILIFFRSLFPIDGNLSAHQWHSLGCQMAAGLIFFGCIVYGARKRLSTSENPN